MGLAEFEEIAKPTNKCKLALLMDELDSQDREDVEEAFEKDWITHTTIQKWFGKRDKKLGSETIRRHRGGTCACR